MSYINREDVVKAILVGRDKIPRTVPAAPYELVPVKPNQHGNSMRGGIRKALRCIEEAPAADVAPIRYGKWVIDDDNTRECHCSECEWPAPRDAYGYHREQTRHCVYCGSLMDL